MAKYKKRADGRYATTVTYLGKKYYFTAKSSAELDRKVQEFKIAKRSGTYSSGMLLKDWCDHYLIVQHAAIRKNSWATIESHIRVHIKPELGDFPLCNLQPANIRDFIATLSAKLASRTVEHIYVTLKALLTQAVIDGVLAKHPMLQIKKPKVTRKREWVALTQAQVTKLLSVITDPAHQLLIKLAATSGMRRSEILGIRYQDVDLERCTFTVRQTNLRTKGGGEIGTSTKTEDSWRTVSLPKAILPLIKAQIRTVRLQAMSDALWQPYGLLFPGEHGRPLNPDAISKLVKRYGKNADMPKDFCLNSLRHTSASLLLQHGASYKTVQQRLGHSTANLTLNTYSHVMPGDDERAAETLANII